MIRSEKKILGNSYISNMSTSPIKNLDRREFEQLNLKISNLFKENEKLKAENAKLKEQTKKYENFSSFNPRDFEEKFSSLLDENRELKENFSRLKEEFINNKTFINPISNNIDKYYKANSSSFDDQLLDAFNYLVHISKFFKAEVEVYSQKLSQKQREYDELYLKYITESGKIYKCLREKEIFGNLCNSMEENDRNNIGSVLYH